MAVGYKSKLNGAFSQPVDLDDVYVRKEYFDTGNLWAWGGNTLNYGQLGDNSNVNKSSPVQTTAGGSNWKTVSAGLAEGAGGSIKSDGTLWNWGYNALGGLGTGDDVRRSVPSQTTSAGNNWKQNSSGGTHMFAIKTDGTLWGWGHDNFGQLGFGSTTTTGRSFPVQTTAGGSNWKQVDCGSSHTAAIKTDGTLWTWGRNSSGQLGDSSLSDKSSPVQTASLGTDWKNVVCGQLNTAAIKNDGTLWLWGNNSYGILGDGTSGAGTGKSSPVQTISGGNNWKQVSLGNGHAAAIKTDGTLWTWGINQNGQLGDNTVGTGFHKSSPVQTISSGNNWKQVDCGDLHTGAVKTDGTLWLWGRNDFGQLGEGSNNPTLTFRSSPVQTIAGGTNWKQVSCGLRYTMALKG